MSADSTTEWPPKGPMELWNTVKHTDPKYTRKVNARGGFTAISAQYQIRRATEIWGPMGEHWGLRDCRYGYVHNAAGEPIEIWIEAVFYYPDGVIEISTDLAYRVGDECRKKIRTDALTKSLSQVGFSANIFLGDADNENMQGDRFDGDRYTSSAPKRQQQQQQQQQPSPANNHNETAQAMEDNSQGNGGPRQACPQCEQPGKTARFWSPGERSPDMECSAGCNEDWRGKTRPMKWWSTPSTGEGGNSRPSSEPVEDVPF